MKRSVPAIAVLLLWASATVQAEPAPGIAGETAPLRQPPPGGKILPHQWTVDGEPLPQPPPSTAGQIAKIDVKRLIDYGPDRGTAISRAAEGNLGPDGKAIAKFEIHTYDAEGREITPIDWKKTNAILNYGIDSEPIPPGSDKAVLVSANAGLFDVENGKVILKLVTVEGVTGDAIVRVFLKNNPAVVGKAKATVGVLMGPVPKPQPKQLTSGRSGLRHISDAVSKHPYLAAGGAAAVVGTVALAGGGGGGSGSSSFGGGNSGKYSIYSGTETFTITVCVPNVGCRSQSAGSPMYLVLGSDGKIYAPGTAVNQSGSHFTITVNAAGYGTVVWTGDISGETIGGRIDMTFPGLGNGQGQFHVTKTSESSAQPSVPQLSVPTGF